MLRIFVTLFLFFMSAPITGYAQAENNPLQSDSEQELLLYNKASDKQLEEAQNVFQRCRKNPILSNEKDCKCYSTKFLETRLALGDNAPLTEILNAISNTCSPEELKKADTHTPDEDQIDLSNVSDKDLKEAQGIFQACKTDKRLSFYVNCECLGAKFLNERLKVGPWEAKNQIRDRILNTSCPNVEAMTGYEYESCLSTKGFGTVPETIEIKDFCECYASNWGKSIEARAPSDLTPPLKQQYRLANAMRCSQPEAYNDFKNIAE